MAGRAAPMNPQTSSMNGAKHVSEMPVGALHDAAALARLHASAFDDGAWSARVFADMLARKNLTALGHVDGFIMLQHMPDGVEILTLAVHPAKRRRGLARHLMAHMIKTLQPAKIWLEVAVDNEAAQALYQGFGFVEDGRRSKYYKRAGNFPVDAVLMKLER
ncbi:MAG TPA: ribosomal-protein-alanine acetyltransferase [Rhodobiaceae bacterium]|nr:ribosomal-protein-alanine acetyltransferase [Rhodobiaceae bacterium]